MSMNRAGRFWVAAIGAALVCAGILIAVFITAPRDAAPVEKPGRSSGESALALA
jgi:hypothetical protein